MAITPNCCSPRDSRNSLAAGCIWKPLFGISWMKGTASTTLDYIFIIINQGLRGSRGSRGSLSKSFSDIREDISCASISESRSSLKLPTRGIVCFRKNRSLLLRGLVLGAIAELLRSRYPRSQGVGAKSMDKFRSSNPRISLISLNSLLISEKFF